MTEPDIELVAPRVDSTTGVDGLWLLESIRDVRQSIASDGWIDPTVAVGGAGLEGLSLVVDPVGSLAGMGVAWLIEHVRPLSEALELLAGDPDEIAAHAQTWANIAAHTRAAADQLTTAVDRDLCNWTGQAADAYRAQIVAQTAALAGIAQAAAGIAQATRGAGQLVAAVRMIVRDLVAEAVATIAARLPGWAAMTGGTLGLASPWVVSQVATLVTEWVTRIQRFLTGLLNSLANLSPLLARLTELLIQQRTVLDSLARQDTVFRMADAGGGSPQPSPRRSLDNSSSTDAALDSGQPSPQPSRLDAGSNAPDEAVLDSLPREHADPGLAPDPRVEALAYDPAIRGPRPGEAETALRVEALLGVRLSRSDAGDVDFLDQDGKTYDPVGNFPGEHFDAHWPNLQHRILGHLEKADYVPVDVSKFTPEQIARLNDFIAVNELSPRVFLVGE